MNDDWAAIAAANGRVLTTIVGFIWWDPGALARYEALGLPGTLSYCGVRGAPLAAAGDETVIAAFYTVHPDAVRVSLDAARRATTFEQLWAARDLAVVDALERYTPASVPILDEMAGLLWDAVEACPSAGRTMFGACLSFDHPTTGALGAWHAINCLREWRNDTHLALLVEADLDPVEASVLHSAWMRYPVEWIPKSRMWPAAAVGEAMERLAGRGLAHRHEEAGWQVLPAGLELRERIEARTNALATRPWRAVGDAESRRVGEQLTPAHEILLRRVDDTAGPRYQPASRIPLEDNSS